MSCKTKVPANSNRKENVAPNPISTNQQTPYPTEPGTCMIQGYVVQILSSEIQEVDEPCKSFPCKASVIITRSHSCGFGVPHKPLAGDTITVYFKHAMVGSKEFKKVYTTQLNLPKLNQEQLFEAQLKIKLLPMEKLAYEIGTYELVH